MGEPAYPDALPPEYRLHWYVLERVLGQGGFGITYLARDTNLDQPVAIKEYLPIDVATRKPDSTVRPRADDQSDRYRWGLDRFIREARTLARFDHPNIVRVHSVFEFNNTAYMVMRFEEGENFAALLERRRTLPEPELMRVLLPVLDGLELIHNAGFIHRDIKPDNLHIRADGSPVLLDFGSARASLGQGRTVTILVAPGYAPFEQYYSSGENQGPWTDIYGLGATCYRAIAGVPPLDAITRSKGVLGSSREVLVPARTIGSGRYSEGMLRAIDHALEFAEKERPQSITDWRKELRQETVPAAVARPAASRTAPIAPPIPPPVQPQVSFPRRLAVGAAFAGVAAVAGAIGAFVVTRGTEKPAPVGGPESGGKSTAGQTAVVPAGFDPAKQKAIDEAKAQADKAAAEKIAAERLASEKAAAEKAETERIAAAKALTEREAAEKAARLKAAAEKARTKERPKPEPVIATPAPVVKPEPAKVAEVVPEKPALNPPSGDGPAFTYYSGLAHRGNGEAMLKVAESYESGRGVAQSSLWACAWYELASRRGVSGAQARKEAVTGKLQPQEVKQCQRWADGQPAPSG